MSDTTLYEVLGVEQTASAEEITAAYRRLVRLTHPDAGGSDYLFRRVDEANKVLSDPAKRAAYDRECAQHATRATERAEEPPDVTVDDGWTRVDDAPKGSGAGERVPCRDRLRGWDWRHRHYNPTGASPVRRSVRVVLAQFFAKRPWLFVLVVAFALAHRLPHVAALLFVVAVLARIGSRRAARHRAARRVRPGHFDLRNSYTLTALAVFGDQVVSGFVAFFTLICGPLRRRARRRRLRSEYSNDWW